MTTLTSANSVLTLAAKGTVYSVPVVIEGFGVDDAFHTDSVQKAETRIGVDGFLSAGKVFQAYKMAITIMPTSPSFEFFETVIAVSDVTREIVRIDGMIALSGIDRVYNLVNGYITSAPGIVPAKRILGEVVYEITFESIQPVSV